MQGSHEVDATMAPLRGLPPEVYNRIYEAVTALLRGDGKETAARLVAAIAAIKGGADG